MKTHPKRLALFILGTAIGWLLAGCTTTTVTEPSGRKTVTKSVDRAALAEAQRAAQPILDAAVQAAAKAATQAAIDAIQRQNQ